MQNCTLPLPRAHSGAICRACWETFSSRLSRQEDTAASTYFEVRVPHFPVPPHALFHHASSKAHVPREASHALEHAKFGDDVMGEEGREPGGTVGAEAPCPHPLRRLIPLSTHAPGVGRGHGSVIAPVARPVLTPLAKVVPRPVLVLVPAVPVEAVVVPFVMPVVGAIVGPVVGVVIVVLGLVVVIARSVEVTVVHGRPRVVGLVRVIPVGEETPMRYVRAHQETTVEAKQTKPFRIDFSWVFLIIRCAAEHGSFSLPVWDRGWGTAQTSQGRLAAVTLLLHLYTRRRNQRPLDMEKPKHT